MLSDDVIVLGRGKAGLPIKEAKPAMPLTVDIEADLGDSFRLRGMGADAELAGIVRIRASGGRAPRVNGTIRVVNGTYAAYGQKLSIERGVLTFNGPYDNPALNILAVRKRPDGEQLTETNVEAGVEVRGTALAPAAKLVSTPSVPDSEKLSWLVLGHGMEGTSGNEAGVLSAAAGALLGGKGGGFQSRLANSLGVDELGLSQAKGLESTVVTVGKRISARAYLSFEQGATTAIEPGQAALQAQSAHHAAIPDRHQHRARRAVFVGLRLMRTTDGFGSGTWSSFCGVWTGGWCGWGLSNGSGVGSSAGTGSGARCASITAGFMVVAPADGVLTLPQSGRASRTAGTSGSARGRPD